MSDLEKIYEIAIQIIALSFLYYVDALRRQWKTIQFYKLS